MIGGLHVSASALRLLQDCPRAWSYRYLRGHPAEDVGPALILGKACHAALALWFERLRDGQPDAIIDEMVAVAVVIIDEARRGPTPMVVEDDELDLAVEAERMLRAFMVEPMRPTRVLGVELAFSLDAGQVGNHPITGEVFEFEETISGIIDLVIEDDDGISVIDHKVGKSRPAVPAGDGGDLQLGIYALAVEELFRPDKPIRLFHHLLVRTKTPKVEMREVPRSPHDIAEALEAVTSGLELIHTAVGHPRPGRLLGRHRSWRCGGCGYRRRCSGDRT